MHDLLARLGEARRTRCSSRAPVGAEEPRILREIDLVLRDLRQAGAVRGAPLRRRLDSEEVADWPPRARKTLFDVAERLDQGLPRRRPARRAGATRGALRARRGCRPGSGRSRARRARAGSRRSGGALDAGGPGSEERVFAFLPCAFPLELGRIDGPRNAPAHRWRRAASLRYKNRAEVRRGRLVPDPPARPRAPARRRRA